MKIKVTVKEKVMSGVIFGKTPKVVDPIKPREQDARAAEEISIPLLDKSNSLHQLCICYIVKNTHTSPILYQHQSKVTKHSQPNKHDSNLFEMEII